MGIAPLSAWQISTGKTLGRAIWKPFIPSVLAVVAAFVLGVKQPGALFAFWLVALVISVTLYEYWRGIRARSRSTGENFFESIWRLTSTKPQAIWWLYYSPGYCFDGNRCDRN